MPGAQSSGAPKVPVLSQMEELPDDALLVLLTWLEPEDACHLAQCCSAMSVACSGEELWRHWYQKRWGPCAVPSPITLVALPHSTTLGSPRGSSPDSSKGSPGSPRPRAQGRELPVLRECDTWRTAVQVRHWLARQACSAARQQLYRALGGQSSVEVSAYQLCLEELAVGGQGQGQGLSLGDLQRFLLGSTDSVLLNLLGVHYCVLHSGTQAEDLCAALAGAGIEQRAVCVRTWTLGPWAPQGFRRKDVMSMSSVTLGQLAQPRVVHHLRATLAARAARLGGDPVGAGGGQWRGGRVGWGVAAAAAALALPPSHPDCLAVGLMGRIVLGTVNEVLRVQISEDFASSAWVLRPALSQVS